MKSRLGNYLQAISLAKMHLVAAQEAAKKDHRATYEHNLFEALANMMVAMNNVASIGFRAKPKR